MANTFCDTDQACQVCARKMYGEISANLNTAKKKLKLYAVVSPSTSKVIPILGKTRRPTVASVEHIHDGIPSPTMSKKYQSQIRKVRLAS